MENKRDGIMKFEKNFGCPILNIRNPRNREKIRSWYMQTNLPD